MYVDVLFVLNFSMNVLSLYLSGKLNGEELLGRRCLFAGGVGALLGTCLSLTNLPLSFIFVFSIALSFLMIFIAFRQGGGVLHYFIGGGSLWGVTTMTGGIVHFLSERITAMPSRGRLFMALVVGSGISITLWYVICWRKQRGSVFVTVSLNGQTCRFYALCDSGNLVKEPISGLPVVMVSEEMVRGVIADDTLRDLSNANIGRITDLPEWLQCRIRIIRLFTAVGEGYACGIMPDKIFVEEKSRKREVKAFLVVRPVAASGFGGFGGIIPASLLT